MESLEQKAELLRLLKTKQLLKKEKSLERIVLNEPQGRFYASQARVRLFFGGNGSGKSFAGLHELAHTHLKTHKFRDCSSIHKTWFFTPDLKKVEDFIEELRKIVPPSQFPDVDKMGTPNPRRLIWKNGEWTTFFSYEQDASAAESTNIDAVFFDEPPPRSIYVAAYRGCRTNPNHFLCFFMTPLDEPWIYTDLYLPAVRGEAKHIDVIMGSTVANKANLSSAWIEEFSASLSDEEKRVRLHGEFAILQGRVFREFSRTDCVVKWKPWPLEWPVWCAVDPHTRKPSTVLWVGVTKEEELVVLDEASAVDVVQLGEKIKRIEEQRKFRIVSRRIDNSGSTSGWEEHTTAIDLLRQKCSLHFNPMRKEEKAVDESIYKIKSLLQGTKLPSGELRPNLFFMENCKETITQMELYGFRENRHPEKTGVSEKVKKVNDDYIDPLRYIVMSRPRFHVTTGEIQLFDPKKLYRRTPVFRNSLEGY